MWRWRDRKRARERRRRRERGGRYKAERIKREKKSYKERRKSLREREGVIVSVRS